MALQDITLSDLKLGKLEGDEMEGLNPTADRFSEPPPPDDGKYIAAVGIQEGPFGGIKYDTETKQYTIAVSAQIVRPGEKFDNRFVNDKLKTTVGRDGSSSLTSFLLANGIEPSTSKSENVSAAGEFLTGKPQVKIVTRWASRYQDSDGSFKEVCKEGQKNHPSDGNGGFQHKNVVTLADGTKKEVVAKAKIVRYAKL